MFESRSIFYVQLIKFWKKHLEMYCLRESNIKELASIFKQNSIVLYPTDTVYGILGNAYSDKVMRKIINIKHRPLSKPFLILIEESYLSKFYFPQTLTFLLKYKITFITKCYEDTLVKIYKNIFNTTKIAFRIPKKYFLSKILKIIKFPLVAPSANISGFPVINNLEKAKKFFGKNVKYFVKGKISKKSSTILEILDEKTLLLKRKGEDFEKILLDCNKRGIKIQR